MTFDTIIKGGSVVTPGGCIDADVAISGEKIAAVGAGLSKLAKAKKVIDAKGHYVMPGVLDVHVHLELPFCGTTSADDYITGTRAGARGGVTTVIDFAIPYKQGRTASTNRSPRPPTTGTRRPRGASMIDYTFHTCITNWASTRRRSKGMVKRGFSTFKEFMIYASEGWQSDDRAMFGTLEKMNDNGVDAARARGIFACSRRADRRHSTRPR
jgi:dihydropyrimidinase